MVKQRKSPDPLAALDAAANAAVNARQAADSLAAEERENRERRWNSADHSFCNIYPQPPESSRGDYRGWAQRIAAFCEVATREGYADKFNESKTTDIDTADALSLIRAGLKGGVTEVASRILELHGDGREGWMRALNADLNDFLGAIQAPPSRPISGQYLLSDVEARILRFLLSRHPILVVVEDIGVIETVPTIRGWLKELVLRGLVERPNGIKGGCQLTDDGKRLAESLPPEK